VVDMLKKLIQIFFGTESLAEMKKKGILVPFSFSALFSFEILILVPVTEALVMFLIHQLHFSIFRVFLVLWSVNLFVSAGIVLFSDKSNGDPTLAEGMRRLFEAALQKSKITGSIFGILVSFLLIFWEGAAAYLIFLRGMVNSRFFQIAIFVITAGVQMAVWTKVYVYGDSFISAIVSFF
jgi:hypothetical protein